MLGVNKVILIGRLGQDPTLNNTSDGTPVCNFSIATSEEWTDKKSGEKKHVTEWHRIVVWKNLANIAYEHLRKGSAVYLEGKIKKKSELNKITQTYIYNIEIHVTSLIFLDRKNKNLKQKSLLDDTDGVFQEELLENVD